MSISLSLEVNSSEESRVKAKSRNSKEIELVYSHMNQIISLCVNGGDRDIIDLGLDELSELTGIKRES